MDTIFDVMTQSADHCRHQDVQERLLTRAAHIIREYYGDDPKKSPDFARIVSAAHYQRLTKVLNATQGRVVVGGDSDEPSKYIAPTIVADVKEDDALMQEELFGPILPILPVMDLDQAIELINRHEKPLALYAFTSKSSVVRRLRNETSSGGESCPAPCRT